MRDIGKILFRISRLKHYLTHKLQPRYRTLIVALVVLTLVAIAGSTVILRYVEGQQVKIGSQKYATYWVEKHVRNYISSLDKLVESGHISDADQDLLKTVSSVGNVIRYKVINAGGTVVYASRREDIGTTNDTPIFTENAMQGGTPVIIEVDEEFEAYERLVSQVYVPVLSQGQIIGAVQVYLEITKQAAGHRLASNISLIAIIILMSATAIIIGFFVRSNIRGRNKELQRVLKSREEAKFARLQEEQARQGAEFANRAKSEFLATMSHELRTPLNAIIGFSEIIRSQMFGPVVNEKYIDYAQDINESGQHLLKHINDILDISKIEAGKVELQAKYVDVYEALETCITLVKGRAFEADIEIDFDIPADLPALYADEQNFKEITINLLPNAIKFTPAGGKITVRIWYRIDNGYVLQIVDTGIGIALEDIPKVLTPFQQIDSDLSRKYDGTGLGLPLVKGLTELHGGVLNLQSEVGVGTTATVRFPAERIVFDAKARKAIAI